MGQMAGRINEGPAPRDKEVLVIPAQAGISGRKVSACRPETPAFAGVTKGTVTRRPARLWN